MYRIALLFSLLLLACFQKDTGNHLLFESERWEQHAANVEIIRDDFGVPHIYGKTDADAVFGLLYAQCEDDFNRVEQNYIWATGRLAEVEGEAALYSDLRANLYMTKEEAMTLFENSPKWLKKLCMAFADGINYYLDQHPEVEPRLLTHFEPWMPMYFSEGSIGGDIERVSTRKIGEFYGQPSLEEAVGAIRDGLLRLNDDEPRGSNGFAISGQHTQSGNAMLLINPHTSFYFRGEVHVVSEEGLNAYGAVTWGQFFVYQGFNEFNGWMHTSTGTDIIDEFEETIEPTSTGLTYQYGSENRGIDSLEVTLNYKTDEGLREKVFTIYRTHHGPITHANGDKWVATALMWDPVDALQQSFIRTKTSSHDEFHEMMGRKTNSSNNTVYADANGNIAYYHGNFIPRRNTDYDYTNPVDGSNPQTDWNGLHDMSENIWVLNPENGWIQNCNSTPFTCCGEFSPKQEDFPKYMTSFPENYRGVHAISLLENADELTIDKLIDLAYDPYLPGAEELMKGLIASAGVGGQAKELAASMEILRNWDFEVSKDSKAMTLAHYYYLAYSRSGKIPRGLNFMERMDYMSNESPLAERLKVFSEALQFLQEDFGSTEVDWGEINRFQRNDGRIHQIFDDNLPSTPVGMTSGRWGALASFGARRGKNTRRWYGVSGNSFVAVVEFGEKVKAKSMLAGGQSGDPGSPHFDDQVQRYVDCQFKEVPYYRVDVLKRTEVRYQPGEED